MVLLKFEHKEYVVHVVYVFDRIYIVLLYKYSNTE